MFYTSELYKCIIFAAVTNILYQCCTNLLCQCVIPNDLLVCYASVPYKCTVPVYYTSVLYLRVLLV